MTAVTTGAPVPMATDDEVEPTFPMSEEERAWWEGAREIAYELTTAGARLVRVADELGVTVQTLYNWRHHRYWRERSAREQQARAQAHAAALFGIDEAAVASLRAHVEKSPSTALRYALARGLLAPAPGASRVPILWAERRTRPTPKP